MFMQLAREGKQHKNVYDFTDIAYRPQVRDGLNRLGLKLICCRFPVKQLVLSVRNKRMNPGIPLWLSANQHTSLASVDFRVVNCNWEYARLRGRKRNLQVNGKSNGVTAFKFGSFPVPCPRSRLTSLGSAQHGPEATTGHKERIKTPNGPSNTRTSCQYAEPNLNIEYPSV